MAKSRSMVFVNTGIVRNKQKPRSGNDGSCYCASTTHYEQERRNLTNRGVVELVTREASHFQSLIDGSSDNAHDNVNIVVPLISLLFSRTFYQLHVEFAVSVVEPMCALSTNSALTIPYEYSSLIVWGEICCKCAVK